jgi:DNA-binding NtrC family response regulator
MKDWSVSLPKKITKAIEKEVIGQNINIQTAIVEALELWLNTPMTDSRKDNTIEAEDIDVMEVKIVKQCFSVDRDCVMDDCRAWINNDCSIMKALKLNFPTINLENTTGVYDNNFTIPAEGIDLNELIKSVEKNIIESALRKSRDSKTNAAKLLNITFDSIRYKIEALGIK